MTGWQFLEMWILVGILLASAFATLVGLGRKMDPPQFIVTGVVLGTVFGPFWLIPVAAVFSKLALSGKSLEELREKLDERFENTGGDDEE